MKFLSLPIPARFAEISLADAPQMEVTAVIPTTRGSHWFKSSQHSYYFLNFRSGRGWRVELSHRDILRPGWKQLLRAMSGGSLWRALWGRHHYGFSLIEQLLLLTIPHTVTELDDGRFSISLWSWFGSLVVDCREKSVTWNWLEDDSQVLGSAQWLDKQSGELWGMSYTLAESFARIADPSRSVASRIFARQPDGAVSEVWQGQSADFLHEILLSPNRQYCLTCELGMYLDAEKNLLPSKVLILDLVNGRQWSLDRFSVAAHAAFDPDESDVVYFSNHNFQFEHSSIPQLMKRGTYAVRFRGPATVFRYRLTPEGPVEIGQFTQPDFFRLTNMHVFRHRGQKMLVAMGFPDEVFLIDAASMQFIRKIRVQPRHAGNPPMVGTIVPTPDGEKLLAHTTEALHVIDIASGEAEFILNHSHYHTCSNHMIATTNTAWGNA